MPKRGPKPQSPKLKLLKGDTSKGKVYTPVSHKRPAAEVKAPKMPADLPARAKAFWKRNVPLLVKIGTVSEVDAESLRALCISWYHWQNLEDIVDEVGYLTEERDKMHPATEAARRAEQRFTQLAAHFGMTPLSRSKIEITGIVPEGDKKPEEKKHGVSEDLLDA